MQGIAYLRQAQGETGGRHAQPEAFCALSFCEDSLHNTQVNNQQTAPARTARRQGREMPAGEQARLKAICRIELAR